jgi:SsrA-binding protein
MTSILNKKARFNYTLQESFEAGLVLSGAEVKAVKLNRVSLNESYAKIVRGELWLINAHISPYQPKNQPNYQPTRPRKILIKKSELNSLYGKLKEKRLTLVPSKLFLTRGLVKIELALAKSKKKYDKRESIKKEEQERETRRKIRLRVK